MKLRIKRLSQQRQKGQVIPYVAFLLLILTAAALIVFDLGYLVNSRIKAQNAADAAALAAVAVKVNKHHSEALVRAGMTQESYAAQSYIRAAQAALVRAQINGGRSVDNGTGIPEFPGSVKKTLQDLKKAYKRDTNRAYRHAVKLHRTSLALQAYHDWLGEKAPTAVREAAQVAYAINIQGYDDMSDPILQKNIQNVLNSNGALVENQGGGSGGGAGTEVGGFIYAAEAASGSGNFGKTFVEFPLQVKASEGGSALLNYLKSFELTSNAAAQLLNQGDTPLSGALADVSMKWYSPRLMAIQGNIPTDVAH